MNNNLSLKDKLAIAAAKSILFIKGGNSSSAPGLLANKISHGLIHKLLINLSEAPILVTGTNGKSTTTGFLASILQVAKRNFIHNTTGANLVSGLTTSLIKSMNLNQALALLEVDEAVIRKVTKANPAQIILVNNFFRDQLDRFGEMDYTIGLVQQGLNFVEGGFLVANADDPNTCKLKATNILYYGIAPEAWNGNDLPTVLSEELGLCPSCGADLKYNKQWLGQFGEFECEQCHYQQPAAEVKITTFESKPSCSIINIKLPTEETIELKVPLPGLFNIYNALGAIACAYKYGISTNDIKVGVESYTSLFGRSEEVEYKGRKLKTFLIKNPIGASEVLRLINSDPKAKVMLAINDNYADGRDVSWLWDAHFEYLNELEKPVYCTGTRGSDIAVRLKYAGVKHLSYYKNLRYCLDEFCREAEPDDNLYVLPTYTALLFLTKLFERH